MPRKFPQKIIFGPVPKNTTSIHISIYFALAQILAAQRDFCVTYTDWLRIGISAHDQFTFENIMNC